MTQRDPASYHIEELTDPSLHTDVLRHMAFSRPDLWDAVLRHPNCYPELAAYIGQRRGEQPPAIPQPREGQAHQQPGEGQTHQQPNQHVQQMSAGVKTFAAGARGYLNDTVLPATKQAAQTTHQRMGQHNAGTPTQPMWRFLVQIALVVLAFFGTIALFLPLASVSAFGFSESFNYFHAEAPSGEGVFMLTGFIVVTLAGVTAILLRATWARITAGVLAILTGLISAINGFVTTAALTNEPMVSLGAGSVLLAVIGVALVAAAVVTLVPVKKQPARPGVAHDDGAAPEHGSAPNYGAQY